MTDEQRLIYREIFALAAAGLFYDLLNYWQASPSEDSMCDSDLKIGTGIDSLIQEGDTLDRTLKFIKLIHSQLWARFHNCRSGNGIFLKTVLPFLRTHYTHTLSDTNTNTNTNSNKNSNKNTTTITITQSQTHTISQLYLQLLQCFVQITFHDPTQFSIEDHQMFEDELRAEERKGQAVVGFCLAIPAIEIEMEMGRCRRSKDVMIFVKEVFYHSFFIHYHFFLKFDFDFSY